MPDRAKPLTAGNLTKALNSDTPNYADLVNRILKNQVKHRRIDRQRRPQILVDPDRYTLAEAIKPSQQSVKLLPLALRHLFDVQRKLHVGAPQELLQPAARAGEEPRLDVPSQSDLQVV